MKLEFWGESEWRNTKLTISRNAFIKLKMVDSIRSLSGIYLLIFQQIESKLQAQVEKEEIKQFLIRLQRDLRRCTSTPEAEFYARTYLDEGFQIKPVFSTKLARHWSDYYGFTTIKIFSTYSLF